MGTIFYKDKMYSGGGGVSSLDSLGDVDISGPTAGQVLTYDATNHKWVNATGGGGTTVVANPSGEATATLNKLQVDNTIYEAGLPEIVTHTIRDTSDWAKKYDPTRSLVSISSSTSSGKWWNFETLNDVENVDYHEEIVYKIPIPRTARKIRYRFETQSKNQNGADNYIVIGLKTTLDTANYTHTSDTNFVFKEKKFIDEDTLYEGELEILPSAPLYLYVTTSGWNLDIYQLDIIEYVSGGGVTRTVLFEAPDHGAVWMDSQGKTFDLNDDIDNYDEIQIIALTTEGDNNYHYTCAQIFMVEDMLVPGVDSANKGMCIEVMADRSTGIDTSVLRLILVSQDASETPKRTLWCAGARGIYGAAIHKVIGIKYL